MKVLRLAGLVAAALLVLVPSSALAQDTAFGVSPTEVGISDIAPGESAQFELSIRNEDQVAHIFTIIAFQPSQDKRREGRAEFPDPSWISFSPEEIELAAGSASNVTVTLAVPPGQEWAGRDWEGWLGVTAKSDELVALELYVRLLVSTAPAGKAASHFRLAAAVLGGLTVLACGLYHHRLRRTARLPWHPPSHAHPSPQ